MLVETISIQGVLLYSDGKPVVEEWVKFKVTKADEKIDGDVNEQTDSAGRFNADSIERADWRACGRRLATSRPVQELSES